MKIGNSPARLKEHGRGKEAVSSTTETGEFLSHKPRPAQRAGEIRKFPCSIGRTREIYKQEEKAI